MTIGRWNNLKHSGFCWYYISDNQTIQYSKPVINQHTGGDSRYGSKRRRQTPHTERSSRILYRRWRAARTPTLVDMGHVLNTNKQNSQTFKFCQLSFSWSFQARILAHAHLNRWYNWHTLSEWSDESKSMQKRLDELNRWFFLESCTVKQERGLGLGN